jgi:hypothetical protein
VSLTQSSELAPRQVLIRSYRKIDRWARMPPVVSFPDCFTRLGGNQYINSASIGAWEKPNP